MASLFTKIINGEVPCHKIAEDDRFLAFLDIRPIHPGHTLVIPKQEVDYIFALEDNLLGDLMIFAKKVARKVEKAIECERIGIMVAGIEVPHAHIHLVPFEKISDLTFANANDTPQEELARILALIQAVK